MNFAETRLAEVRWMNFAELASRKFAEADDPKTSSHRLLKIGNLSAGVAARMRPRSRSGPCPLRPHTNRWKRGTEQHNHSLHDPLTALLHALTGFCECQPPA